MILTKEVETIPSGVSFQYYKNLGYDVKWREPLMVKVEDLPKYSEVRVDVLCDMCKEKVMNIEGCRQMHIISCYDKLPSDTILIQMLQDICTYFSENQERSWIEFNIDNSIIRNATNKDGIFFDYGELHRITNIKN